jgi:uncharacterized protein YhhL (DUF1145 family)
MGVAKAAIALLWMLCVASFFAPSSLGAASWWRTLFWLLLIAHTAESLVFLRTLRSASGSLGSHLVQTLLFGMIHIRELQRRSGS